MLCRHCHKPLQYVFLDLGAVPPSNAYLRAEDLQRPEIYFPLKLYVCEHCWLVQTQDFTCADELFTEDYAYFSSVSQSWLRHASEYCQMIQSRLNLNSSNFVLEIGSNDGYLLRNFVTGGIPCLGIEPTDSTADAAQKIGIPVLRRFFGKALAEQLALEGRQADLIIGNNVYAHVPDINDFTSGLKALLKPQGTITLEFPHLMWLIQQTQFDTVYHEHFSYLSLYTVSRIFASAELRVFDVEELPTHGGSLRVYGCHDRDPRYTSLKVAQLMATECQRGLRVLATYQDFQARANRIRDALLTFLLEQKEAGKKIAAYGAAAKGNTLLNYAGITADLVQFVCDASPSKQGRFMPKSHIPIVPPSALATHQPDWVLILPWNIADEVMAQERAVREWNGRFAIAVPSLRLV